MKKKPDWMVNYNRKAISLLHALLQQWQEALICFCLESCSFLQFCKKMEAFCKLKWLHFFFHCWSLKLPWYSSGEILSIHHIRQMCQIKVSQQHRIFQVHNGGQLFPYLWRCIVPFQASTFWILSVFVVYQQLFKVNQNHLVMDFGMPRSKILQKE